MYLFVVNAVGSATDGEPAMRGRFQGYTVYLRSEQCGLGDNCHTCLWDFAHQYQLVLAAAIKTFNRQRNKVYEVLHWIARNSQKLTKQSPRRNSILVQIMEALGASSMLKVKKVYLVRFVQSERDAFRALLKMLPYLYSLCKELIARNMIKLKAGGNRKLLEKENNKHNRYLKKITQARIIVFLSVQCDNHDNVHVKLSKMMQSDVLIATDLPALIDQNFTKKLSVQATGAPVPEGHVAHLMSSPDFFKTKDAVYTNRDNASMPVQWPGSRATTAQKKKYVVGTVQYVATTTLNSHITPPRGDDDDEIALFDIYDDAESDSESDEDDEPEESDSGEEGEDKDGNATKCTLIGPFLVPVLIPALASVLNVHKLSFILQDKPVPDNYCAKEIRYLYDYRWSYVTSFQQFQSEFNAFWEWVRDNKSQFMKYADSDEKKSWPILDHMCVFKHL
jgi:hypothetical protein